MGIMRFLKALFGKESFSSKLNTFDQLDEYVQFSMFKELRVRYAKQYKPEFANALAVQVIKYLMAIDLDSVRQSAEPEERIKHDSCRHNVETEADKLMQSDPLINELVRRSLMTKFLLYSCRWGTNWTQHKDGQITEERIRQYDEGQPDVYQYADIDKYIPCANRYLEKIKSLDQI